MSTPYCPKCGSVTVRKIRAGKSGQCLETDCGHIGYWKSFTIHLGGPGYPNDHWRDPIAMLPGGYDDNQ